MPNKPAISILIPVYNGGDYLVKTLDNILASTFEDFEVICVEDFSTDESLSVLEHYAKKDPRIKIIRRTFKGGTAVKGIKYGLPYCSGDYYFFMSQDDLIDPETLERLYHKAIETGADAVVPDVQCYYEEKQAQEKWILPPHQDYEQEMSGEEAFKLAFDWNIHGFYLRKMDLLKKIGFDDTYFTGCEYMSRVFFYYANKVVFVKSTFYYRQDNANAITKTFKPYSIEEVLTNIQLLEFMYENKIAKDFVYVCLKKTINLLGVLKGTLKQHYADFTPEQKKQSLDIMKQSRMQLLAFALKTRHFLRIPKILSKSSFNKRRYERERC